MSTKPLRKLNIYMQPEQKAALQLTAARAGVSVSAFGRNIVYAALETVDPNPHESPGKPEKQAPIGQKNH